MARPKGREPRVDIRRHRQKDREIREYPGVRFYDADGVCRRLGCASPAEAEHERARMVVEGSAQRPGAVDGSTTLEAFWPVWLADARERLAEGTVEMHEYFWRRRVQPRFGNLALRDISSPSGVATTLVCCPIPTAEALSIPSKRVSGWLHLGGLGV